MAAAYQLSTKSITRSLNEIKNFLAWNRELTGNTKLEYSYSSKAYRLLFDGFLTDSELYAVTKMIIGSRALAPDDALRIIGKIRRFTAPGDRGQTDRIIDKESGAYLETGHDCENVMENLWLLINAITKKKETTITFYKEDRTISQKRIRPVSLEFSECNYFLTAYLTGRHDEQVKYRVDRITRIIEHRKHF